MFQTNLRVAGFVRFLLQLWIRVSTMVVAGKNQSRLILEFEMFFFCVHKTINTLNIYKDVPFRFINFVLYDLPVYTKLTKETLLCVTGVKFQFMFGPKELVVNLHLIVTSSSRSMFCWQLLVQISNQNQSINVLTIFCKYSFCVIELLSEATVDF